MNVKTIVAIGGGELRLNETFAIDKYIVNLSGKKTPKALSILTASGEPEGYIETFNRVYGVELGCETDTLKILTEAVSDAIIRDKILCADIIYVGGGNTAKMITAWTSRNIGKYLTEAYNNGTILSGLSAGSICWFEHGHSDSFLDETGEHCIINGLGFIPGLHCPHYNDRPNFDEFMKTQSKPALAIEDNCAIVFQNDCYKIIKANELSNAYLLENQNGAVKKRIIDNLDFKPINTLLRADRGIVP